MVFHGRFKAFFMIYIFYGRGKGKTSAALGAAMRAAGQGWSVLVVQFMKDVHASSGEVNALGKMSPPVEVIRADLPYSIFHPPSRQDLDHLKEKTRELFVEAASRIRKGSYQMVVLDELGVALTLGWIESGPVRSLLENLPAGCELIITGRNVPKWLLDKGDLVTQMRKIRHPFDRGVKAKKGVEF